MLSFPSTAGYPGQPAERIVQERTQYRTVTSRPQNRFLRPGAPLAPAIDGMLFACLPRPGTGSAQWTFTDGVNYGRSAHAPGRQQPDPCLRKWMTAFRETRAARPGACGLRLSDGPIPQAGKACLSRTAISFSTSDLGRGWSMLKRRAPDEVG